MGANPNRLVRTLLVDKNGVLTTRMMRPETTPDAKNRFSPPMLVPAPATADTNDQFLYLVYGPHAGGWERNLASLVHEDDETTIPLAVELLTTGSELSQRNVSNVLDIAIDKMGDAYAASDTNPEWKQTCPSSFSPDIKQRMIGAWHIGNLIEETGVKMNPIDLQSRVMRYDMEFNIGDLDGDRSEKQSYWRGLAVLAIINPPLKDTKTILPGFVTWVAEHPDPRRVIDLVRERNTLDVRILSGVIKDQDQIASSLRDGAI